MDGASALAALASAAVAGENGKENNENAANKETSSSTSNGTSTNNAQDQASKRDANWFDVGIIKGMCSFKIVLFSRNFFYFMESSFYFHFRLFMHCIELLPTFL